MKTRMIRTSSLDVEFHEWNPDGQHSIVLLHGWPDSYLTWSTVAPGLAEMGYRVVAPSMRGCSKTTFISKDQARSGQPGALGRDLLEFADALELQRPVVVGHDWGARAVAAAVGLEPKRFAAMVMISIGYATNYPGMTLSVDQAARYWYHWFMTTPMGRRALEEQRDELSRQMWLSWSPAGWFKEQDFLEARQAFSNKDWVEVVLHYYHFRWGLAPGDSQYEPDEIVLRGYPEVTIPSLVIHGAEDRVNPPESSEAKQHFFKDVYHRVVLPRVGHFPQREDPLTTIREISDFLTKTFLFNLG